MTTLSLLPPVLVLLLGYFTRKIIFSLFCGILLAALIATQYNPLDTLTFTFMTLWHNAELDKITHPETFWHTWNLFICIFLFALGVFVVLLQHSGGVFAYGNYVKKFIKHPKGAETSSLLLSHYLFIDDYFSSLTVGSVMQPLTDQHKIPRAKLAFLVDSMSAPLAILCPFSSWVAAILGFLRENGISETPTPETFIIGSPLATYFHIIPYIFYSFIIVIATWFIVRFRISFGLMHKHERIALEKNNLFGGGKDPFNHEGLKKDHTDENTALIDFFIPVIVLLLCVFSGMLYSGEWAGFGGNRSIFGALQYSNAAIALFLGGLVCLSICILYFIARKKIKLAELPAIFKEGIQLMAPAVIILMLAWSLGDILRNDLKTGDFLAQLMLGNVPTSFLPMIFFFTASIIAFTIGSSWGTAAMLFPIAIPMVVSLQSPDVIPAIHDIPILFPVLGAILSGCVAGDHISPISDTTIMSITSTKTPLMDHIQTQFPYAMPYILLTGLAYFIVSWWLSMGYWLSSVLPMLIASGLGLICMFYFSYRQKRISRSYSV